MIDLKLEIELLSESILGSGESVPGSVDLEVLHDECGLPYFKGKTLKGRLREETENILRLSDGYFKDDDINNLFGYEEKNKSNKITFSDCIVSENIKNIIKNEINKKDSLISELDIFDSLTEIRTFTAIGKNGVAKDSSLRQLRTINKGLILECTINIISELTHNEKMLLALATASLKHIGLMCSRGKGNVRCKLYEDKTEITKKYIEEYCEGR